MEHVIVNLYEQNIVNFHILTKSNQLFNDYHGYVNIVKHLKLTKLTFIKQAKVNTLKQKIISTKNLLTKKNTKKFMSRNKLRSIPSPVWGYPLPHLCAMMPIIFMIIHVLKDIRLLKHITISLKCLIINQLQKCLKIHVLDCHFVSLRIIFTLFSMVIRTYRYSITATFIQLFYITSQFLLRVLTICHTRLHLLTFVCLLHYSVYLS